MHLGSGTGRLNAFSSAWRAFTNARRAFVASSMGHCRSNPRFIDSCVCIVWDKMCFPIAVSPNKHNHSLVGIGVWVALTVADSSAVDKLEEVMVVLTRSAQRKLGDVHGDKLSLRESVTSKASAVWLHREHVDMYSGRTFDGTFSTQVDHVLEVQLSEMSLVAAFQRENATVGSFATIQAAGILRVAFNGVENLNNTTAKHNQAKRGPFTAAINRLNDGRLRSISLSQLASQGRAKWLVDNGDWTRIETEVVRSHETIEYNLCSAGVEAALPSACRLVEATIEELTQLLVAINVL